LRFEKRDYEDNDALDKLAHRVAAAVPELQEATEARFKAFYSSAEPEHIGGKCRRLDGAVRSQTHLDYFVLVHKDPFILSDNLHRIRMLAHELYHMAREKNTFAVRRHGGDFCEIPQHDKYSYRLALRAMVTMGLKYPDEEEARKYAGID
jgi:hypothetical protein